jgi:hypothetical protein
MVGGLVSLLFSIADPKDIREALRFAASNDAIWEAIPRAMRRVIPIGNQEFERAQALSGFPKPSWGDDDKGKS